MFFTHEIQRAYNDSRATVFAAPEQHLGESHIVFCLELSPPPPESIVRAVMSE